MSTPDRPAAAPAAAATRDAPTVLAVRRPAPPGAWDLDWTSPLGATGLLLGWVPARYTPDGGVPDDVARILGWALCASHTVVGRTRRVPYGVDGAWVDAPGGAACACPPPRWWRRRSEVCPMLATRDPARAAQFFDEPDFVWTQRGQTLLLAAPHALPKLSATLLDALDALPLRATPADLAGAGLQGVVIPSVDGVAAGLYVPDAGVRARLLDAVAHAAWMSGGEFLETDEEQLALWLQSGFARGPFPPVVGPVAGPAPAPGATDSR